MEEPLIEKADGTSWYENDQPIKEFLESYKKPATPKEDLQTEELSWLKIMKKSKKIG